ncbi:hypothetical protein [Streptomyces synnematoformans]
MPSEPRQRTPLIAGRNQLAVFTAVVCVLSVAAAVVSFAKGYWVGVIWVLLAGLSSNMTWFYVRRSRAARDREQRPAE